MINLKQWDVYRQEIYDHNRQQWDECNETNERYRRDNTERAEQRRASGDWYVSLSIPMVTPFTKSETIEGYLSWCIKNNKKP